MSCTVRYAAAMSMAGAESRRVAVAGIAVMPECLFKECRAADLPAAFFVGSQTELRPHVSNLERIRCANAVQIDAVPWRANRKRQMVAVKWRSCRAHHRSWC